MKRVLEIQKQYPQFFLLRASSYDNLNSQHNKDNIEVMAIWLTWRPEISSERRPRVRPEKRPERETRSTMAPHSITKERMDAVSIMVV